MNRSRQDRIKELESKKKQLEARIQKLKAAESAKKRKEDTRRKILLGSMVMKLIETGYWQKEEIYEQLDKFLDKQLDRKLFGFLSYSKMKKNDLQVCNWIERIFDTFPPLAVSPSEGGGFCQGRSGARDERNGGAAHP